MSIRIAILTDGIAPFETGGMQTYCANLVQAFMRLDVQVMLFHTTVSGNRSDAEGYSLPAPHQVKYIPYPYKAKIPLHYIREQKKLSQIYYQEILNSQEKPDIIYAHGFTACYDGFKSLVHTHQIPIVINLHGMNMFQPVHGLKNSLIAFFLRKIAAATMRNANGMITLGKAMTSLVPPAFSQLKISEIPCATSDAFISSEPVKRKEPVKFLFVGRNDKIKGMDVFIRALKRMEAEGQNLHLTVVGDWPTETFNELQSTIRIGGQMNQVSDLKKVYQEHHVLVLPSYSEGFPLVILEAMASGCLVIATRVGCVPEIAGNKLVWLVQPGDDAGLTAALKKARELTPVDFESIAAEAQMQVKNNYTWPLVAERTCRFLTNFVNKKS